MFFCFVYFLFVFCFFVVVVYCFVLFLFFVFLNGRNDMLILCELPMLLSYLSQEYVVKAVCDTKVCYAPFYFYKTYLGIRGFFFYVTY